MSKTSASSSRDGGGTSSVTAQLAAAAPPAEGSVMDELARQNERLHVEVFELKDAARTARKHAQDQEKSLADGHVDGVTLKPGLP